MFKLRHTTSWFLWCAPLCGATIALIPYLISTAGDAVFGMLICDYIVAPVVGLVLIVFAISKRQHRISILAILAFFCSVSWISAVHYFDLRDAFRWMLFSKSYKAVVLAQQYSPNGGLRHVEWDGWGFPGVGDTNVYVVNDPEDSLSIAASEFSGKYDRIPCGVTRVHRLERNWFSVTLFTETDWDHCM